MAEATVEIVNKLGLHARAAAKLVRKAGEFRSAITISDAGRNVKADAKDILSILSMAEPFGSRLEILAVGPDEADAIAAVTELFSSGFGEL